MALRRERTRRARGRVPRAESGESVARAAALRARGAFAVGDGALGFWSAVRDNPRRPSWFHKPGKCLTSSAETFQPKAKLAHAGEDGASRPRNTSTAFVADYEAKYPKTAACLATDREALLTFFAFPAEHWIHLRTTNVIESVTFGPRVRPCGCGSTSA